MKMAKYHEELVKIEVFKPHMGYAIGFAIKA